MLTELSELHSAQSLAEQGVSKGPPPYRRAWQRHEMANSTRVSRRVLEEASSQRHSSFLVCAYFASIRHWQGYQSQFPWSQRPESRLRYKYGWNLSSKRHYAHSSGSTSSGIA